MDMKTAIKETLTENEIYHIDSINEFETGTNTAAVTMETGNNEGYYVTLRTEGTEYVIRTHNYTTAKQITETLIPNFMPCNF